MRNELDVRKELENLKKKMCEGKPYSEIKRIALQATKQALEWTIEEKVSLFSN